MPVPTGPTVRPSPNVDTPMDQSLITPRYIGPPTFPQQSYPKSAGHKEPSTAMIQHDHVPRDTRGARNRGMSLVPEPMSRDHSSRHMNANPPPSDHDSRPPWRTNPPSWNQPPMDWRGSHVPPPPDSMYGHGGYGVRSSCFCLAYLAIPLQQHRWPVVDLEGFGSSSRKP